MKTSFGSRLWRWQRYTAILALPLLIFHVVYQLYVSDPDALSHEAVSPRIQVGLYLLIDVLLLMSVSAHASIGMRNIIVDYAASPQGILRATSLCAGVLAAILSLGLATLAAL